MPLDCQMHNNLLWGVDRPMQGLATKPRFFEKVSQLSKTV
jgi:hypothetical protein